MTDDQSRRLVFVSHSGTDTWVARQIAREIAECGAVPFLDEAEIDVGADFEDDILAFLDKADELVVLITPWALDRPYVWAELGPPGAAAFPSLASCTGFPPGSSRRVPAFPSCSRSGICYP